VTQAVSPFNGIVRHLTQKCGGNVNDKKVVKITAGDIYVSGPAKNAADLGTNKVLYSALERIHGFVTTSAL
jgi:hypothetical protein